MYPISFEPSAFDRSLCSIASDWEAREKLLHSQLDKEKRKEISLPPFFGFFRGPSSRISFPSVFVSQSLSSPFSSAAVGMEADKQNKNEKGAPRREAEKYFLFLPERGDFPLGGRSSLFPTPILLRRIPLLPSPLFSLYLCYVVTGQGKRKQGEEAPPFLFLLPLRSGE